jgi:DNA-directed RNA polymerase subunit RPC12/RpoP
MTLSRFGPSSEEIERGPDDSMARPNADVASFRCIDCQAPIPADSFVREASPKRLLAAACPRCHRRVTLVSAIWGR